MPQPAPPAAPSLEAPGSPARLAAARERAQAGGGVLEWMDWAFQALSSWHLAEGHAALARALELDPHFLPARWLQFQTPTAPMPRSDAEAAAFAQQWERGLAFFESLDFAAPDVRRQVWGCVGSSTGFYRHYLGDDVTALQRRHGELVHRMMAQLDRGEPPREPRSGKRRVLFCSPYFYEHTVARLFLPLIERLDRARFDIHLLHFGPQRDAMTLRAAQAGTLHAGERSAPQWRQMIAKLHADAVVYLDIGMDPLTQVLAALRLAPCQAALWGHPVTTGLPTLDAFLSPDEMEPPDAQSHYTERLVRLPGLGHGLMLPAPAETPAAEGFELFCSQSVYKLLPGHDALFARVLARLPQARLHLVPHQFEHVREELSARMRPVFAAHGVDFDARVQMHGHRPHAEWRALAARCILNLDTIGWSGGMSSIDLLGLGLPTVTLPGASMRSRQTAALLRRLDAPELIVANEDDYVDTVVALANDTARRGALIARLRRNLPRLDDAGRVVETLEAFLAE